MNKNFKKKTAYDYVKQTKKGLEVSLLQVLFIYSFIRC